MDIKESGEKGTGTETGMEKGRLGQKNRDRWRERERRHKIRTKRMAQKWRQWGRREKKGLERQTVSLGPSQGSWRVVPASCGVDALRQKARETQRELHTSQMTLNSQPALPRKPLCPGEYNVACDPSLVSLTERKCKPVSDDSQAQSQQKISSKRNGTF